MSYLYFILAVVFALTIHEAGHAWVALKLGDPTAKRLGRVTLNPIKHLDLLGSILFLAIGIGWGKPVPVNPNNFQNPQRDNALVAFAGPLTNLLTAIILAIPFKYLAGNTGLIGELHQFIFVLFEISLLLFVLNLLPIPPLDGSKIFGILIPKRFYNRYQYFMEANLVYILIFFFTDIYLFPDIFGFSIISEVLSVATNLLKTIIFIGT